MGEYDVDDLLEQAFQKVEEVDKNGSKSKKPMDELVMQEAKKAGITEVKKSDDAKKRHDDSGSEDDKSSSRKERKRKSESRERDRKKDDRRSKGSPTPSESRSKKRSRSRERKRKRSRSRSGSSHRHRRSSPERKSRRRSRTKSPRRSRSPLPARRRSRSPYRSRPRVIDHRGGSPPWRRSPPRARLPGPERRDVMPFSPKLSPPRNAKMDMTAEERDERTIFILQLSRNTRPRDLEEFFSSVGHVRDVRIITDSKTRRSKGIAYVEFWEKDSVPLAMGLNGQTLLKAPLVIQMTCAERNRLANATMGGAIGFGITDTVGPLKICVSNLHAHITDDMLSAIFEPFGRVVRCDVARDPAGVSKGYGYVHFRHADEGKKAFEQLNGFELAGKNIRLTTIDEEYSGDQQASSQNVKQESLESEDRMGLGSQGRLHLMSKLAESSGMQIPQSTKDALAQQQQAQKNDAIPDIATQCFMLSNMFDPASETDVGWENEVRDDVIDECNNNGGILHVYVDKASAMGNVYVKCPSVAVAHRSVNALHGRYFAGKIITANYVPVNSYHDLFPDARTATTNLITARH